MIYVFLIILILSALVALMVVRCRIGRESEMFVATICQYPKFASSASVERLSDDFYATFLGRMIVSDELEQFRSHYSSLYFKGCRLVDRMNKWQLTTAKEIKLLIDDYESLDAMAEAHNERVENALLKNNKDFFDHCLSYPLDEQQRRSIVSEEKNCLVVSSAGSGKTSSIVGRVKYLVEMCHIDPCKILLISYTHKAALELTNRMGAQGLRGYTFHKLALDIIGKETGEKPSICDNTDSLLVGIYRELIENDGFKQKILSYFVDWSEVQNETEQSKVDALNRLSEFKMPQIKSLLPDMDGHMFNVRSVQEQRIAYMLSSLGVKFRYEEPYEYPVADGRHAQYCPDFSIYFSWEGKLNRVYLEHFGVDEHGLVPVWFAKDRGITYEEANEQYNDGIIWKQEVHKKFGTKLIVTSSADFARSDIRGYLKGLLTAAEIPIHELDESELYELVVQKGSAREKMIIRLVATFISLFKSSGKSLSEVLQAVNMADDGRSRHIISNIFLPVVERYEEVLRQRNQIDFTDAILQATEICKTRPQGYEHIIVDEFQDISMDRCNFLKALRDENTKLYCVGDDWQSIYRFSGSDMALFSHFEEYFGKADIHRIETTYRFGEPLVGLSSAFVQRNAAQLVKSVHSFSVKARTDIEFVPYNQDEYCVLVERLIRAAPAEKSFFLLGRYSFDDYFLSKSFKSVKRGERFCYIIAGREVEFLTVHKSKGLEADYVILLQCNRDVYGFPSLLSDDSVLSYVLSDADNFPFGEERRLFYVAITRAKEKTMVLYDRKFPSVFVKEFLNPSKANPREYKKHRNAHKIWTKTEDTRLVELRRLGKEITEISRIMGRSKTAIVMRLGMLERGDTPSYAKKRQNYVSFRPDEWIHFLAGRRKWFRW